MSKSLKLQKEQQQRDLETRYESSYHQGSLSSVNRQSYAAYVSSSSSSHGHKISKKEKKLSTLSKKEKRSYLAVDKEEEVIGYVVPVFRSSHLATQDLMETQEEVKEEGVGYVVMRNLFSRETDFKMRTVKKSRETSLRESAERLALSRKMHEKEEFQKKMNPDSLTHPPEFVVKPRGQTVWEGKSVTLHCTVAGWPKPRVAWYKNNVLIDAKSHPEKYVTESQYNMHSLEIKNCSFSDTAEYRISALNVKGESSAFAPDRKSVV